MSPTVLTEHTAVAEILDRFLTADPVRGTILGTLRDTLTDTAWLAVDGELLAARSSAQYPVVLSGGWTGAAARELAGLLAGVPDVRGAAGPLESVEAVVDALGRPVTHRNGQRLFRLDELTPPVGVPGRMIVAEPESAALVEEWFVAFGREVHDTESAMRSAAAENLAAARCRLWLHDGAVVSLAARRPAIGGSARIGPVYTPPSERGHGYASAVTAALTQEILDEAAVPVLFTDLDNPTSNKIYQQLGYRPVEDRLVALLA